MSWIPERRDGALVLRVPNFLIAKNREELKELVLANVRQGEGQFLLDFVEIT